MNILLSIHPKYAAMIYAGEKKIELRTTIPRKYELCEDYIFLYETAPIFAVTGWMKVDSYINVNKILNGDRKELKRMIINESRLTMEQIKEYKPNLQIWGWHIKEAYFSSRDFITRYAPNEKPPQSWCYTNAHFEYPYFLAFDHKLNEKSSLKEKEIFERWKKGGLKCHL